MFVHFRKRLNRELVGKINEQIVLKKWATDREAKKEKQKQETEANNTEEGEALSSQNQGKLILDATCTPADISYPTDIKLLNQARDTADELNIRPKRRSRTLKDLKDLTTKNNLN